MISYTLSLEIKINRKALKTLGGAGFTGIKYLLVDRMVKADLQTLAISTFSKIYSEKSLSLKDLTYFLDDVKLSIDNNYTLKVDLVFKFFTNRQA